MNNINATVVADSLSPQGDRLTSLLITFPRIILAEINTHRMLSKNTSSSRAIPFNKMVEAVKTNPFIPIAWQKHHSGMQGNEYWDITFKGEIGELDHTNIPAKWLRARDTAVTMAEVLHDGPQGVTKQLANRLLEPFMWTTMLITGSTEGWENFFNLRCPAYTFHNDEEEENFVFKSKKDAIDYFDSSETVEYEEESVLLKDLTEMQWLKANCGQAEIHIMDLAEKIYDAIEESISNKLKPGEWHIPMLSEEDKELSVDLQLKYAVGIHANTSYTVVGEGNKLTLPHAIKIHDKCKELRHSSVFEHCARAMSDNEYYSFIKGNFNQEIEIDADGFIDISTHSNNSNSFGWCRNFKGFISYRHIIENN